MMDADSYKERLDLLMPISDVGENLRFADLFAGIGGFHFALSRLGLTCELAIERCVRARAVYAAIHGIKRYRFLRDVLHPLPSKPMKIDLLCGGFPCQPFSLNGFRKGLHDQRGLPLVQRLMDIINELYPTAIILENVPGLFKMKNFDILEDGSIIEDGLILDNIVDVLEQIGYQVLIRRRKGKHGEYSYAANEFGIPQARERLFIVGFRRDLGGAGDFEFPEALTSDHPGRIRLEEIAGGRVYKWARREKLPENGFPTEATLALTLTAKGHGKRGGGSMQDGWKVPRNRTVYRIVKDDGSPDEYREFTPEERLQLMGFPGNTYHCFPESANYPKDQMLQQTGNGVVTTVIYHLARAVVERVKQIDPLRGAVQLTTPDERRGLPVLRSLFRPRPEVPGPLDPGYDITGRLLRKERERRKRLKSSGLPKLPSGPRRRMIDMDKGPEGTELDPEQLGDGEWQAIDLDAGDDTIRRPPKLPSDPRPPDEPCYRLPQLSEDALFVLSLGLGRWFRYADSDMETASFISRLDKQIQIARDCIESGSVSPPGRAWWRTDGAQLLIDIRHRGRVVVTLSVIGGLVELERGLMALRRSASDYAFEELLCDFIGKKFVAEPVEPPPVRYGLKSATGIIP